jgi:hypothetical protein
VALVLGVMNSLFLKATDSRIPRIADKSIYHGETEKSSLNFSISWSRVTFLSLSM